MKLGSGFSLWMRELIHESECYLNDNCIHTVDIFSAVESIPFSYTNQKWLKMSPNLIYYT